MPEAPEPPRRTTEAGPDSKSGEAMRAALERTLMDAAAAGAEQTPPPIPDHTLLHRIGSGAYGEVWLARSTLGAGRAVKVIYRARFKEDRPYEREFHGVLKYEPISRTHAGLVQVLHAGRDETRGCFYYVMELADAAEAELGGRDEREQGGGGEKKKGGKGAEEKLTLSRPLPFSPAQYTPRTLRSDLARQQRLPPAEAAQVVLRLAGALEHLHARGLVHRDIKPSNVIFVGGQPKLADIGLVTDIGRSHSFVGTEGFIPPEGPGTPQADIYSLGKLLYELATGRDRMDFPQLPPLSQEEKNRDQEPTNSPQRNEGSQRALLCVPSFLCGLKGWFMGREEVQGAEGEALLELNEVMTRACAPEPRHRYASATELQAELNLFLAGRSLRRTRHIERHLARSKRFALVAGVVLVLGAVALWLVKNEERHANERARQATERARAEARLRQRAEAAEHETQQQLYTALLEQARATVRGAELGHRVRAVEALRRAAAISNTAELRREMFAALALPDLRLEREWPTGPEVTFAHLDPSFERMALGRGKGPVEIQATSDRRVLATLPASTNLPAHNTEWSADGRFLAVKRDYSSSGTRADLEVWETAGARRVLLLRDVPLGAVSFHPRLRRLVAGRRTSAVVWNLEDGQEMARFRLGGAPLLLRYAPAGERFAALYPMRGGLVLSVHDATNGAPLASHAFTDLVGAFQWHPGGRWLAVPDHSGAVHWMDAQTGETRLLGRHKAQAVMTAFSPDGAWLISGGWEREMICWDAQTLRRVFTMGLDSFLAQFREDGRGLAVVTRSGVQLHAFERPVGYREFAEELGPRLRHAAFSPDGRWLAASAEKRAGVWDLFQGGAGALDEGASDAHLFFTPDGQELFGSRSKMGGEACFRWRMTPATNATAPPGLARLPLHQPAGFTFLSLSSNAVVLTSSKGSQVLAPEELATGQDRWTRTYPGINGVSPDGRWLAIFRPFTPWLYVYRLPGLERVAKLTHHSNINDFEFSPLADEVAITSSRGAEFWSTTNWKRTRVLTNFARILYAPDARSLWLTKDLSTAGLYDARTLEPRLLLPTGTLPLAVSPDGRHLAVSVDARRLQVWDLVELRARFRELGLDWSYQANAPPR